jgi:hypothetical protein
LASLASACQRLDCILVTPRSDSITKVTGRDFAIHPLAVLPHLDQHFPGPWWAGRSGTTELPARDYTSASRSLQAAGPLRLAPYRISVAADELGVYLIDAGGGCEGPAGGLI